MEIRERAEQAQRILDSETFKRADDEAREEVVNAWINSQNASEREALWHRYHALDHLPNRLRSYVDDRTVEERRK